MAASVAQRTQKGRRVLGGSVGKEFSLRKVENGAELVSPGGTPGPAKETRGWRESVLAGSAGARQTRTKRARRERQTRTKIHDDQEPFCPMTSP